MNSHERRAECETCGYCGKHLDCDARFSIIESLIEKRKDERGSGSRKDSKPAERGSIVDPGDDSGNCQYQNQWLDRYALDIQRSPCEANSRRGGKRNGSERPGWRGSPLCDSHSRGDACGRETHKLCSNREINADCYPDAKHQRQGGNHRYWIWSMTK
jgi:hypothetical protein